MTNKRALIIVDVQNDFCEGGRLPVAGGADLAGRVSDFLDQAGDRYDLVVATRDWHIDPGDHFALEGTEPDYKGTWPAHCVAGTPGADYHPALRLPARTVHVVKGMYAEGYSGFDGFCVEAGAKPLTWGTKTLDDLLKEHGVIEVDVVGIAEDFCVKATFLDAGQRDYWARAFEDLTVAARPGTAYDGATLSSSVPSWASGERTRELSSARRGDDAAAPGREGLQHGEAMTTLVEQDDPALADLFSRSQRVLVLTGAGVSAPSGLPTYRGAGGVYNDTEVEALHHAEALPGSLDALWGYYGQMRQQVASVEPNPAHRAIAAWQLASLGEGRRFTLATQNIDDLHERASSQQAAHLHGSLYSTRCMDEGCAYGVRHDAVAHLSAPPCPVCGGRLRPAIVLFGERLFAAAEHEARLAVRDCDLLVAIGTSTVVSTALALLRYATDVGAAPVCIDPAPEVDERFALHLQDRAELALPGIVGEHHPASSPEG